MEIKEFNGEYFITDKHREFGFPSYLLAHILEMDAMDFRHDLYVKFNAIFSCKHTNYVHFEKEEDAKNALYWIESRLLIKELVED